MNQIVLHLGSNVGDRKAMLHQAISLIQDRIGKVNLLSSVYETEAWGKKDQSDFLNQAVLAETGLNPGQAMESCKAIEKHLGSVKSEKWGPRAIDIDILFYNQSVYQMKI
ncbi:MAG: 2-amino-4-hydroxy-6-hydroxymethyldihydropteridine diphosphokinase [Saprospiraceae bacterium]|nr:2-amino-4-hydroxy-6-hydroxymethyldihydropteridine diphosphokinase [Saprospiraceae bacterium]